MTVRDIWVRPTIDQVIDALSHARDLIDDGWTQGTAHRTVNGQTCFCAMGAAAKACPTIRLTHPVMWGQRVEIPGQIVPGAWLRDAVTAALVAATPPRYPTVALWNDEKGRTKAEVIMLFNKAIEIVRMQVVAA